MSAVCMRPALSDYLREPATYSCSQLSKARAISVYSRRPVAPAHWMASLLPNATTFSRLPKMLAAFDFGTR